MSKKLIIEEIRNLVESKGGELISEEYENNSPIVVKTIDGVVETRYLQNIKNTEKLYSKKYQLKKLSDKSRHDIEHVRKLVESKGAKLLSTEYKNDITPLKILFEDGEIEERVLVSIRKSKKLISKKQVVKNRAKTKRLTYEEVKEIIESKGGKLLSKEYNGLYEPLEIETIDGKIELKKLCHIKNMDKLYSKEYNLKKRFESQKLPIDEVRRIIESKGGELLSEKYNGYHLPIKIKTCDEIEETRLLCNIQKVERLLSKSSCMEYDVVEFIKSIYNEKIITTDRTIISPAELDIVLPDKKLSIECNGIYWHSDVYKHKKYHLEKTKKANEAGYELMHITDSDWYLKNYIIKDLLKKKLGIVDKIYHARRCNIVEISYREYKEFLEKTHLQSYESNSFVRYGLTFDDKLISVMGFSKPRFKAKDNAYELCRFSQGLGISVNGGFSRLLKHFIKLYDPKSIKSFCDIAYFNGNIYKNNGFKFVKRTDPNYKYFIPGELELESRNKYQKHKLHKILENFDSNKSEYKNMLENGYLRIWDCGNDVYEYFN